MYRFSLRLCSAEHMPSNKRALEVWAFISSPNACAGITEDRLKTWLDAGRSVIRVAEAIKGVYLKASVHSVKEKHFHWGSGKASGRGVTCFRF